MKRFRLLAGTLGLALPAICARVMTELGLLEQAGVQETM